MKWFKEILGMMILVTINSMAQEGNSSVYVNQIGDYNSLFSSTNTVQDQSVYSQRGDYNSVDVSVRSNVVKQNVEQLGNGNSFENYSYNSFNRQEVEVMQKGNNIDIQVFGSNSMSEGMKILVTGNDKALIVRNFN